MKTYAFLTSDGYRVDVKASSPKAGYNKLIKAGEKVTTTYFIYDKDGTASVYSPTYHI